MARVRSASQTPARKRMQGPTGTDHLSPQSPARSRNSPNQQHGANRVSNGRAVSTAVRPPVFALRYHQIASAIMHDQGGPDRCSETRQHLIRRFAAAAVLAEQIEAQLARGETIDIKDHALLCSIMVNVARLLGRDKVARNVTSALAKYLEQKADEEGPE
jgi:hypothetical protein